MQIDLKFNIHLLTFNTSVKPMTPNSLFSTLLSRRKTELFAIFLLMIRNNDLWNNLTLSVLYKITYYFNTESICPHFPVISKLQLNSNETTHRNKIPVKRRFISNSKLDQVFSSQFIPKHSPQRIQLKSI